MAYNSSSHLRNVAIKNGWYSYWEPHENGIHVKWVECSTPNLPPTSTEHTRKLPTRATSQRARAGRRGEGTRPMDDNGHGLTMEQQETALRAFAERLGLTYRCSQDDWDPDKPWRAYVHSPREMFHAFRTVKSPHKHVSVRRLYGHIREATMLVLGEEWDFNQHCADDLGLTS